MNATPADIAATDSPALADLRHDLRTPIGHILGYGEMVVDELRERGQDDLILDVEKMRTAGGRLLTLVNERLNAASLGLPSVAAKLPIRPADVLPLAPVSAPDAPAPQAGRLLVVDDNEDNREVLSRRLTRQGHTAFAAASGSDALALLAGQDFDVVLLDLMMPEMDGYEVLARIKADPRTQALPVIMISALDELDSVVRCIEMGAADYLPKPFNPILLRARVGACLREKYARDREQQIAEELQANYRRLQELERLRDDLTHMIVHDLRTPLTSLLSGVQTVPLVGELNDTQREMIAIVEEGGQTLLGMINDLLDVEKMEQEQVPLSLSPLAAATLIASAVSQVSLLVRESRLTLTTHTAPDVPEMQGDGDKLRRTLVNLLGNAIKFTPTEGTISVTVGLDESGRSVRFAVSDTGEGIPSEAFGRIFEKFGQVESRQRGRKMSTGLGLAFCKMAVEAHGGRIGVESAPGQGSTFYFTVPLSPPDAELPPQ